MWFPDPRIRNRRQPVRRSWGLNQLILSGSRPRSAYRGTKQRFLLVESAGWEVLFVHEFLVGVLAEFAAEWCSEHRDAAASHYIPTVHTYARARTCTPHNRNALFMALCSVEIPLLLPPSPFCLYSALSLSLSLSLSCSLEVNERP